MSGCGLVVLVVNWDFWLRVELIILKGMIRTLTLALESRLGIRLPATHLVMLRLVEHAAHACPTSGWQVWRANPQAMAKIR